MSPHTCLLKMLQKLLRLTVSEIFQAQLIQKRLFPKCIWCFCIEKFLNFLMISLTVFQCVPCFFSKETVYFRKPLFCRLTEFLRTCLLLLFCRSFRVDRSIRRCDHIERHPLLCWFFCFFSCKNQCLRRNFTRIQNGSHMSIFFPHGNKQASFSGPEHDLPVCICFLSGDCNQLCII